MNYQIVTDDKGRDFAYVEIDTERQHPIDWISFAAGHFMRTGRQLHTRSATGEVQRVLSHEQTLILIRAA